MGSLGVRCKGRFWRHDRHYERGDPLPHHRHPAQVVARHEEDRQMGVARLLQGVGMTERKGGKKMTRCKYCGAKLRRDVVGQYCPTKNCQWGHGIPEREYARRLK